MGRIYSSEPDRPSLSYWDFEDLPDIDAEPDKRRDRLASYLLTASVAYDVNVRDLYNLLFADNPKEVTLFELLAYRLAERGYDVYNSDTRFEVYEGDDQD